MYPIDACMPLVNKGIAATIFVVFLLHTDSQALNKNSSSKNKQEASQQRSKLTASTEKRCCACQLQARAGRQMRGHSPAHTYIWDA